jgi:hypothetical protein
MTYAIVLAKMMLIPLFDLKKLMIPSVRTSSCVLGSFPSLSGSQPGGFTPVLAPGRERKSSGCSDAQLSVEEAMRGRAGRVEDWEVYLVLGIGGGEEA